jgi:hypothetical protein
MTNAETAYQHPLMKAYWAQLDTRFKQVEDVFEDVMAEALAILTGRTSTITWMPPASSASWGAASSLCWHSWRNGLPPPRLLGKRPPCRT